LPWLKPGNEVLYRNFEPDQLAPWLDESGVAGTVVVQAAHDEAETAWLLELAQTYAFIKGVVGWVDLTAPDLGERLAHFTGQGPYCGVRAPLLAEKDGVRGFDRTVLGGLQVFHEQELAVDLLVKSAQLKYFTGLFETLPGIPWVINHLAQPPFKSGDLTAWREEMRHAARYPNVFCKVSGMVTQVDPAKSFEEQTRPVFEAALELFGPDRLLWGSDWPVSFQATSYRQTHDLLAALVVGLSETEQAAIWGGTAAKVYKLKV
jgi:L-fuconolactonase